MEKTDVVYMLGTGSKWNNNEIRFSLRSIEKNLQGFRHVFIVGDCPKFLQNVIHIQANDIFDPAVNADGNIITKVLAACRDERLSDNFLLMADDSFVLQPVKAAGIPWYYKINMADITDESYFNANDWRKRLGRTKNMLASCGQTTYHFDCHLPVMINKEKFQTIFSIINYARPGYTMKSVYANFAGEKPVRVKNMKYTLFEPYTEEQINQRLLGKTFASVNDGGLTPAFIKWINNRFFDNSRYENQELWEQI